MTDQLDSSTLQAIKQAGLESRAVRYLSATKQNGYKLLNRLDGETTRDLLGLACGRRGGSAAVGVTGSAGAFSSPTVTPLSGDCAITSRADDQLYQEFTSSRLQTEFKGVQNTGNGKLVRATTKGDDGESFDVTARYLEDGEGYVRGRLESNREKAREIFEEKDPDNVDVEWDPNRPVLDQINDIAKRSEGVASSLRGEVMEDAVLPQRLRQKYGDGGFSPDADGDVGSFDQGYIPAEDIPFEFSGSDRGIDGLAIDSDGTLRVVESKVKNKNGRMTKSGSGLENTGPDQLNEEWISNKFENMVQRAESDTQQSFVKTLRDEGYIDYQEVDDEVILTGVDVRKELVVYQDGPKTGGLASTTLRKGDGDETLEKQPTVDRYEAVKMGNVYDEIGGSSADQAVGQSSAFGAQQSLRTPIEI
jgi:hypothetical protein